MPIPHRTAPKALREGCVGYLDVDAAGRQLRGGLLLLDAAGRPLEFVHNRVELPAGPLWPAALRPPTVAALVHTLFAACRREPDLLACLPTLGPPEFLREAVAPAVPFAVITPADATEPAALSWLNEPPLPAMRAARLAAEICRRGLLAEPFDRVRLALDEIYLDLLDATGRAE